MVGVAKLPETRSDPMLQMNGTLTVADGGMANLFETYFNGKNFATSQHGPDRYNSKTHFHLEDQPSVFKDMGQILLNLANQGMSWVNSPNFMPVTYSEVLEESWVTVRFDKLVFPEQVPNESVSRVFGISKERVIARKKRFGLGIEFDVENMLKKEGQDEFALFYAKLVRVFTELVAFLSMARLAEMNVLDIYYFNDHMTRTMGFFQTQIKEEVKDTWAAHKGHQGPFPTLYKFRSRMVSENPDGGAPSHIVVQADKEGFFKFGVPGVNEFALAGPPAEGMLTTDKVLTVIQGAAVRPMPSFAQDYVEDGRTYSMLSRRAEHGNYFVWRNEMLKFAARDVNVALQGYLSFFSETENNMFKHQATTLNENCGRWEVDGRLHHFHTGLENDQFTFRDSQGQWRGCRVIGDMNPEYLSRKLMKGMVNSFMKDYDRPQLQRLHHQLNQSTDFPKTLKDMKPEDAGVIYGLANRLKVILGGDANPLFHPENMYIDIEDEAVCTVYSLFVNVFGCIQRETDVVDEPHDETTEETENSGLSNTDMNIYGNYKIVEEGVEDESDVINYEAYQEALTALQTCIQGAIKVYQTSSGKPKKMKKSEKPVDTISEDTFRRLKQCEFTVNKYLTESVGHNVNLKTHDIKSLTNFFDGFGTLSTDEKEKRMVGMDALATILQAIGSGACTWDGFLAANGISSLEELNTVLMDGRVPDSMPTNKPIWKKTMDGDEVDMEQPDRATLRKKKYTPFRLMKTFDTGANFAENEFDDVDDEFDDVEDYEGYKRTRVENDRSYDLENGQPDNVGDSDNLSRNIDRAMKDFYDTIERGVALCLLSTPVHRDVFDAMLRDDVFIPTEYLIVRPWMKYNASAVMIIQGGAGLGGATVGFPLVGIEWTVKDQTGLLHATQYCGAAIKDQKRKLTLPYMFYEGVLGGAGHEFFTEEELAKHVKNHFRTRGENAPSLLCMTIPEGSWVNPDYVALPGYLFTEEKRPHYETWAYYGRRYSFANLIGHAMTIYERMLNRNANMICFQGTQAQAAAPSGVEGNVKENKGHHGMERPGDRHIRETGSGIKEHKGISLFSR
jgi:hypothetical protein